MSHIQFELRALEDAVFVAQGANCDDDYVIGGLAKLWLFCWRRKVEVVTAGQLASLIRRPMTPQLVEFGFLEEVDGGFRVRGAQRYLRVHEACSKGGHAAKGNLIPGNKKGEKRPVENLGSSREAAEKQPRKVVGSLSATPSAVLGLPPNIDHRSSIIKESAGAPLAKSQDPETEPLPPRKPRAVKPPPDPRHAPLRERCYQVYLEEKGEPYVFEGGRDGSALKELLVNYEPTEIEGRWRRSLRHKKWPTVVNLAQLRQHWGQFAQAPPAENPHGNYWPPGEGPDDEPPTFDPYTAPDF